MWILFLRPHVPDRPFGLAGGCCTIRCAALARDCVGDGRSAFGCRRHCRGDGGSARSALIGVAETRDGHLSRPVWGNLVRRGAVLTPFLEVRVPPRDGTIAKLHRPRELGLSHQSIDGRSAQTREVNDRGQPQERRA